MTVWHLRDLASGKRTLIKCDEVRVINIPHFEGLTVEELIKYAKDWSGGLIMKAFPSVENEILKLPRAYLGNIIYTVAGDEFQEWVQKRISARNSKVMDERDMLIDLDPEIAKVFRESTSVSGKYDLSYFEFDRLLNILSNQGYQQQPHEAECPAPPH